MNFIIPAFPVRETFGLPIGSKEGKESITNSMGSFTRTFLLPISIYMPWGHPNGLTGLYP